MGHAGVSGSCISMALLWLKWKGRFIDTLALLKETEKMSSISGNPLLLTVDVGEEGDGMPRQAKIKPGFIDDSSTS